MSKNTAQKKTPMLFYSASVSYIVRIDDGLRERSGDHLFAAKDDLQALRALSSLRGWCDKHYNQVFALTDHDYYRGVDCIKLSRLHIEPPMADGSCCGSGRSQFFEWKVDYPGTLEDWVASKESLVTKKDSSSRKK